MNLYKTILVAIDLTHYKETLKKARLLADSLGSTLYLVHAVEVLPLGAYSYIEGANDIKQHLLDLEIQKVRRIAQPFGILETQQFIKTGSPKQFIIEKANELQADLIVIGSYRKTGLEHLLGSTASTLVNCAERDVMVIFTNQSTPSHVNM